MFGSFSRKGQEAGPEDYQEAPLEKRYELCWQQDAARFYS